MICFIHTDDVNSVAMLVFIQTRIESETDLIVFRYSQSVS